MEWRSGKQGRETRTFFLGPKFWEGEGKHDATAISVENIFNVSAGEWTERQQGGEKN